MKVPIAASNDLEQLGKALPYLRPGVGFELLLENEAAYLTRWAADEGTIPTEAELQTGLANYQAALDAIRQETQATRSAIFAAARGAEGKLVTDPTAAERNAINALVWFKVGALSRAARIRKLEDWL